MAMFNTDGKAILIAFIGAIIAASLITVIADQVVTDTLGINDAVNVTVTAPAANSSVDILGRELITRVAITNASEIIADAPGLGLRTIISSTTGLLTVQLVVNDSSEEYIGQSVNTSYSYVPDGFAGNQSRAIVLLITFFASLAIMIFVIITFIDTGTLGKIVRGER